MSGTFVLRGDKFDESYLPSYDLGGEYLNETHRDIAADVANIDGWLHPADAAKLYELAFLAPGPILEIGCFHGKSTAVIATAIRDSGRRTPFVSLDVDGEALNAASRNLTSRGLGALVTFVHGTAEAFFAVAPRFRPAFVFVDGDHSEDGVTRDLQTLEARLPPGGLLLFHDYLDGRNNDPAVSEYGVTGAIDRSWVADRCEFGGTFGCAGLFRFGDMAEGRDTPSAPVQLELLSHSSWAVRMRQRVLRPAARRLRRIRSASRR